MPTLIHSIPKYRKHWASGHAAVTLQGKEFYLGPWKSKASLVDYDRLIAEWLASPTSTVVPESDFFQSFFAGGQTDC